jgi:secreted trypsin-like serine protease
LWPADQAKQDVVNQKGVVAGWGLDENNQVTAIPYSVEMPVVAMDTCLQDDPSYHSITSKRSLCVGEKNGRGPCHGDSGSGFVMKMGGKWVLRGIVSAGLPDVVKNTCDLTKYVVLADASKYMDWILMYFKI